MGKSSSSKSKTKSKKSKKRSLSPNRSTLKSPRHEKHRHHKNRNRKRSRSSDSNFRNRGREETSVVQNDPQSGAANCTSSDSSKRKHRYSDSESSSDSTCIDTRGRSRTHSNHDYRKSGPSNRDQWPRNDRFLEKRPTPADQEDANQEDLKNKIINFDTRRFKSYFDRMFFRDYDIIKKGSIQYEDFWKFHEKIQRRQMAKGSIGFQDNLKLSDEKLIKISECSYETLSVPRRYAKQHTVPFSLKYTEVEDYIYKLNPGKFPAVQYFLLLTSDVAY